MAQSDAISPAIGRLVNGYRIVDLIATGGMSRVYRALAPDGTTVALKLIQFDEMAADYERRLRREPAIQSGTGHENIVRLIDWFRLGGELVLVLEFVDGRSLWQIIHGEAGPLPFVRARGYLLQIAPALEHLHRLGIIHRDIKPSNILVSNTDHVKLADFGIAKFSWQQGATRTQHGIGTPEYMSPEQARGGTIDHRTDIYSLGVTLYESLTGRTPFARAAETPQAYMEVVHDILSEPVPDPRTIAPGVPSGVVDVIMRATAKEPDGRFSSAREMAEALGAVPVEEESPRTVSNVPVAAGAVSAVLPITPAPPAHAAWSALNGALWTRPRVVGIALVALLVVAGALAAAGVFGSRDDATTDATAPDARGIAGALARNYEAAQRSLNAESLAALYAPAGVNYFGRDSMSRESILMLLRHDFAGIAGTDSFAVTLDSAAARGDTAIDVQWRTAYARSRTDGSRFSGSTRDRLTLRRTGTSWLITRHERTLVAGVLPEAPAARRPAAAVHTPQRTTTAAATTSHSKATRRAVRRAPQRSTAPPRRPTVVIDFGGGGIRVDVGNGKHGRDGNPGRGKGQGKGKKNK